MLRFAGESTPVESDGGDVDIGSFETCTDALAVVAAVVRGVMLAVFFTSARDATSHLTSSRFGITGDSMACLFASSGYGDVDFDGMAGRSAGWSWVSVSGSSSSVMDTRALVAPGGLEGMFSSGC